MTLTIQDLGALGEFFGSIAVLVTLIYLAFQTRQNTMAIGAQLDAALISATQNLGLAASTSTEMPCRSQGSASSPRYDRP